jgi:hypothetical protein
LNDLDALEDGLREDVELPDKRTLYIRSYLSQTSSGRGPRLRTKQEVEERYAAVRQKRYDAFSAAAAAAAVAENEEKEAVVPATPANSPSVTSPLAERETEAADETMAIMARLASATGLVADLAARPLVSGREPSDEELRQAFRSFFAMQVAEDSEGSEGASDDEGNSDAEDIPSAILAKAREYAQKCGLSLDDITPTANAGTDYKGPLLAARKFAFLRRTPETETVFQTVLMSRDVEDKAQIVALVLRGDACLTLRSPEDLTEGIFLEFTK